jgi:hypothetical protein
VTGAAPNCDAPSKPSLLAVLQAAHVDIQRLADRCYELLRQDPHHSSLHFKKVGRFWSVRVGLHYRAGRTRNRSGLVLDRIPRRL